MEPRVAHAQEYYETVLSKNDTKAHAPSLLVKNINARLALLGNLFPEFLRHQQQPAAAAATPARAILKVSAAKKLLPELEATEDEHTELRRPPEQKKKFKAAAAVTIRKQ